MANSENTPAKLLGNFLDMINTAEATEGYRPSNVKILVDPMKALHTAASAALDRFHESKPVMLNSKKQRAKTVQEVKDISQRALNMLKSSDVEESLIEQATSIYRLIQGYDTPGTAKPSAKKDANESEEESGRSNRQTSQDSLVQNFTKFIGVLKTEPLYTPNEDELKIAGMQQLINRFKTEDTAASSAAIAWSNNRGRLEVLCVDPKTGVTAIMKAVKVYAKGAFAASSAKYKQFAKIKIPVVRF